MTKCDKLDVSLMDQMVGFEGTTGLRIMNKSRHRGTVLCRKNGPIIMTLASPARGRCKYIKILLKFHNLKTIFIMPMQLENNKISARTKLLICYRIDFPFWCFQIYSVRFFIYIKLYPYSCYYKILRHI